MTREGRAKKVEQRLSGEVVKLDHVRGFGFARAESGVEYFFHATAVDEDEIGGLDAIQLGDRVSFVGESTAKGPRGFKVKVEQGVSGE